MYVTVAVATGVEGYTTLAGLIAPVGFHGAASFAGIGLVGRARAIAGETAAPATHGGPQIEG